jgi:RES domain-containing protein
VRVDAWRIVKARYADQAFTGEGTRRYGGRWNSPGTSLVYTSGNLSLCILEMLVHLQETRILSSYVTFKVEIDSSQIVQLGRALLPANWREYPAPKELALLGEAWAAKGKSLVLEVPSAVVERESNYLINPSHPDFASLHIEGPFPYELDTRLTER